MSSEPRVRSETLMVRSAARPRVSNHEAVIGGSSDLLNRLPRIRHRGGEAAIDGDRLSIDIGGLIAGEEQTHRRELVRLACALQRIELADLVLRAALLGAIEHRPGHAGLD